MRAPLYQKKLDEKSIREKLGAKAVADARGRSDFYIHNSHKGYTHGCIEVSDSFFTKLKEFREKYSHVTHLTVRVHYSDIHTDTHGDTHKTKRSGLSPFGEA